MNNTKFKTVDVLGIILQSRSHSSWFPRKSPGFISLKVLCSSNFGSGRHKTVGLRSRKNNMILPVLMNILTFKLWVGTPEGVGQLSTSY